MTAPGTPSSPPFKKTGSKRLKMKLLESMTDETNIDDDNNNNKDGVDAETGMNVAKDADVTVSKMTMVLTHGVLGHLLICLLVCSHH